MAVFRPSVHAFGFRNAFAADPVLAVGPLRLGDARNGLCGGMVFAARDYFEAGRVPPPGAEAPRAGTPLFRYLVRRLFAAFDLPAVRAALCEGHPVPLGVVAARGASPRRLRFHHVVLAYALTEPSTLHVYDPNSGPSDDVTVTVGAAAITSTVNIGRDIRGLFPLRYRTVDPTP